MNLAANAKEVGGFVEAPLPDVKHEYFSCRQKISLASREVPDIPWPVSAILKQQMQVLQAGRHRLILLEIDAAIVTSLAQQIGFETRLRESPASIMLDLTAEQRETPLLLFDASDPANLGWFSRCQFYVDGRTGGVMQTPLSVANKRDRAGHTLPNSLQLRIAKELPDSFRLPGKQPITEQVLYAMLKNFLQALLRTGVGVCGGPIVQPLAGRLETPGARN